ncbi:MAG: SprT family zinc-dependent metalloprotease [Firmicutes bacterium]|nr:SprT family zinc-dependent metalloprotease [Bacillota bacterium]
MMIKQIEIIRSNRRTVALEINRDLRITVRAPMRMKQADIEKFINEKSPWIEKHLEIMKTRNASESEKGQVKAFTEDEIRELEKKALASIPPKVEAVAQALDVSYGRITIRNQRTRWGSCSSNGNLNFNCLLVLCPDEVTEYVIVHELCHRKHMNHSKEFWTMVEKY